MELFYEAEQMKKKRFILINLIAVWYCHNINIGYWKEYEKGNITANKLRKGRFSDFLKAINFEYNASEMSEIYLDNIIRYSFEIENALKTLKYFSAISNTALITNGLSDVQHKRIKKHQLEKYFQHIFISDEMGVSKPHCQFFEQVYKKIAKPNKNDVLVLGDNPHSDILGANNFGYHSLFFNYGNIETKNIKSNYKINKWNEIII